VPFCFSSGRSLMTMMDLTLARSAGRYLGHDRVMATVQLSCNIMAAAREDEEVYGEAQVERATRLLTFVSGRLRVGERTLMTGTGVFRNPPETGTVSV
jgi:acyl-coenzyme A thioesterase PaaI-like protein